MKQFFNSLPEWLQDYLYVLIFLIVCLGMVATPFAFMILLATVVQYGTYTYWAIYTLIAIFVIGPLIFYVTDRRKR